MTKEEAEELAKSEAWQIGFKAIQAYDNWLRHTVPTNPYKLFGQQWLDWNDGYAAYYERSE